MALSLGRDISQTKFRSEKETRTPSVSKRSSKQSNKAEARKTGSWRKSKQNTGYNKISVIVESFSNVNRLLYFFSWLLGFTFLLMISFTVKKKRLVLRKYSHFLSFFFFFALLKV